MITFSDLPSSGKSMKFLKKTKFSVALFFHCGRKMQDTKNLDPEIMKKKNIFGNCYEGSMLWKSGAPLCGCTRWRNLGKSNWRCTSFPMRGTTFPFLLVDLPNDLPNTAALCF